MFSGQLTTPDRFSYHTGSDFQYCHVSPTQGLNSFKSVEDCSKWRIIWITIQCEYFGYNQFHHLTTEGQPQELLTYCIFIHSFILETCIAPLPETTTQRRSQPSHGRKRRTSERCKIWKGGPSARNAAQRGDHSIHCRDVVGFQPCHEPLILLLISSIGVFMTSILVTNSQCVSCIIHLLNF